MGVLIPRFKKKSLYYNIYKLSFKNAVHSIFLSFSAYEIDTALNRKMGEEGARRRCDLSFFSFLLNSERIF